MKIFKKIAAGLLAFAVALSAIPVSAIPVRAEEPEGNSLRLWYDEPVSQGQNILSAGANYNTDADNRWQQHTLPIGNGDMGANVYGEIVSEHLTFNEKTLWTGGPSSSRPNYKGGNLENKGQNGAIMEQVQNLFLAGQTQQAVNLCNQLVGSSDGYGAYQPWGDIWFDYSGISANVTEYQRDLDLTTGIASVSFAQNGTEYTREYFISHDDNVLVARLEAKGDAKLNLDVRFTSKQGGTTVVQGTDTLVLNGKVNDNQLKYASYLTVVPEGGTVTGSGSKLTVKDAEAITVYVSAATDYKNTFWNEGKTDDYYYRTGETDAELAARVVADVNKAVENGYEAVKASHLADYQEMFDRVELELGQTVSEKTTDQLLAAYKNGSASEAEKRQLEVMLFQYGRYLTIASSREDSQLPSNLQGVWNVLNNPPWASDYHMNVNLQMNYWPTYSTNLAECAMPLIDYIDSLREPGRITAKIYNGVDVGFSAHTQNTPFGWTCPGWAFSWGWSPAAVPWILQNCWEYYEYTGDVDFMEEYLYPMMKEEALFYDAILIEDNEGKLVSAPAYSPEHGPYTLGNTYEQSLVWQLYEDVVIAAETLGVDADLVAKWKANQANLKGPIEIGDDGQLKEWYEETTITSMNSQGADAAGHRHLSHMLGLFPGDLVQRNPEWVAAAKVSMDYRTDNSTGWGMGQRINTWARLGEGNKAHELIGNLFKGGIYPNLWDSHAPFQIDGNFGMTSGVAEMLMQSNMGFINLLPALPDVWSEGSVDGLVARGNFEIAMTWVKGGITEASILSRNGGEAIILADNITLATVKDSKGNTVDFTVADGKIAFDTVEGETYTLTIPERPEAPAGLAVVREGMNVAKLTWNAVEGAASYNVYRASGAADAEQIATGLTETAYTDEDLDTEANSMTYYVTAVRDGIESIYSNGAVLTAPATYGMVDNLDGRIAYNGLWANWSESVNYNGSIMYLEGGNYSTDATVTLQFIGTGIEVLSCTNHDRSYMEIFIDGESCGEVDTYSASTVRQVKVFTKDDLPYGMHTIVIVPMEKNNPACTRGNNSFKLELDAFNVLDAVATAPEEGEVNLVVGETATYTDETGYYVGADVSALDTSVATVEITGEITSTEQTLSENVTGVNDGKTYVFYNKVAQKLMSNKWADASVGGGGRDGLSLGSSKDAFQDYDCWTVTAVEGGYHVQDKDGKYLSITRGNAVVKDEPAVIALGFDGTDWTIGENGEYANDFGGKHTAVAGWSDINDTNSQWEIYEVTTTAIGTTTITFTGVGAGETSVQIGDILYNITVKDPAPPAPPVIEPGDDSWDIPLADLEVSTGDYETNGNANEGPAHLAVDGNPATMWHTEWDGSDRANHWFQFELTEDYVVNGLRYLPRQTGNSNGTITKYQIQVSDDGQTFRTVAEGDWADNSSWKIAQFPGESVKYVRLQSVDSASDQPGKAFASAAEIRLTYQPSEVSDADKTALNALIAECELIEQGNYTAKSWQQFTKALERARTISANAYASQAQVDEALAALAAAKDGLKEKTGEGPQKIFHLDSGRKFFSKDWTIALINELSAAGYTHLQLAFGNNGFRFVLDDMTIEANGTTYASDDVKEGIRQGNYNYGALTGYYVDGAEALTEAEMNEIIAHGKSVGIEIIPHLNMPGHMSALLDAMEHVGIANPYFTGRVKSDSSVDLTNEQALEFMRVLVDKYAKYFSEKGVKYFHIGADEYANDAYNGSMGFPSMGATLYAKFAEFVNGNAAIVKSYGMTPRAWNDGIYYGSYTSEFDSDIEVNYWSSGWGGYTLAKASTLDAKGHGLINTNGDYYFILGKDDRFTPGSSSKHDPNEYDFCASFDMNRFMDGSIIEEPIGGMFCVWADYPGAETEQEVAANIRLVLRAMALGMEGLDLEGMNTGVIPGGFNADGSINNSGEEPGCEHKNTTVSGACKPSCEDDGYTGDTWCLDCEKCIEKGELIPALGHEYKNGKCERCGDLLTSQFEDVEAGKFYFDAVAWAVENKVTEGMPDGTFAPTNICTRGQVVTFLWRAAGSPAPKSTEHPFTDVKEGKYYYDAMLWAVENGITKGMTTTTFAPDATCTRAQVVTFLWRAKNMPKATNSENPFTDVTNPKAFYYEAMLWAVENEITTGINATTFAPDNDCTRGHVVTFLYRAYNN